jgi:hypothetical protein
LRLGEQKKPDSTHIPNPLLDSTTVVLEVEQTVLPTVPAVVQSVASFHSATPDRFLISLSNKQMLINSDQIQVIYAPNKNEL